MAAAATLDLLIQLHDQASSELDTVADSAEKAGRKAETSQGLFGKLGGIMGTLGGIAGGVALGGITALGGAIFAGLGDAREAAQINARTTSVIASMGGAAGVSAEHVADFAASLSAASGKSLFGDTLIQESSNLLLTFGNIKGSMQDLATTATVDMAAALGGAPADAAMQLGKALNDPVKGVTALGKVGVTFSEDQKKMIASLVATGDTAGAQKMILDELGKQFGGAAQAAADADGGFAQFKDSMGEAAETMGAALLPAVGQIGSLLASPAVMGALTAFSEGIATGLGNAISFLTTTVVPAMTAAWPTIQTAIATVIDFLSTVAWPAIQTVFGWIVNTGLPLLKEAFAVVWPIIQTAVATVFTFLSTVVWPGIQAIFSGIQRVVGELRDAWGVAFDAIRTTIQTWQEKFEAGRAAVALVIDAIKKYVSDMAAQFGTSISDGVAFFTNLPTRITTAVGDLGRLLFGAGASIIQGLIDGINSMWQELKTRLSELTDVLPDWKGPASKDAMLLFDNGRLIMRGLRDGIHAGIPDVRKILDALTGEIPGLVDPAITLHPQLGGVNAGDALTRAIGGGMPGVPLPLPAMPGGTDRPTTANHFTITINGGTPQQRGDTRNGVLDALRAAGMAT